MIVIQCVDDRGGVRFHGRRQSQDRLLRAQIVADLGGRRLWMNNDSYRMFRKDLPPEQPVSVEEAFLGLAAPGETCFVEGLPLCPWLSRIEQVVLYRWNRCYPADTYLDLQLDAPPWRWVSRLDFPGFSHQTITKEVYIP